ncbi:MAG: hypothetical protein PHV63_02315 [Candidatus Daviesbacteria bacterium]|nr:hypothetical protein [Candidatus Daviesbacteria bacterium]
MIKFVVASDERNRLTDFVVDYLKSQGHQLVLLGTLGDLPSEKWIDTFLSTEFNEEGLNEARKLDE